MEYSPKDVVVSFGPLLISGFAEDTFVTAEHNSDAYTHKVGADGEVTWSKSADRSGKIELTLMASSSSNAALTAMHAADRLSPIGVSVLPILIKDNYGYSLATGARARITKMPKAEYGKEVGTRVWTFIVEDLKIVEGGAR